MTDLTRYAERLERRCKLDPTTGCLEWQGYRMLFGHGQTHLWGQKIYAHRLAWIVAHEQPIPDGLCVLHRCDNPPCCNPDHLFLGTRADNQRDMKRKGRGSGPMKMTPEQIIEIKRRRAAGERGVDLAAEFEISQPRISDYVKGRHRKLPIVPPSDSTAGFKNG
jgi:hypothetical protein